MSEARRPKHLEIKEDLARRIRSREFKTGQALPSQAQLSQDYGVTLMTLRQALRGLQDENLIVQQAGRGTFVGSAPATLDLRWLNSLAEDMQSQGVVLSTEVLGASRRTLPAAVAAALHQPKGSKALRLERLRRVGRRAAVHQVSWVPEPWAVDLLEVDFGEASLYESLRERCSVVIATADETLHARSLPGAVARVAGLTAGRPVMVTERVTYDTDQVPVVSDSATILSDALRVTAHRTLSDIQLSWSTRAVNS